MPDDPTAPDATHDPDASDDMELAGYGQAVDVAVHVPTLSGAVVCAVVAAVVWVWRQVRRGRAAAT
ncbi:MAG TPA: hypothetical protein VE623_10220 [Acidimicrobiales bacterium]|nr:hypothetical protein [Acidimicrobiales bacterium]